jgi:hypothetical protein
MSTSVYLGVIDNVKVSLLFALANLRVGQFGWPLPRCKGESVSGYRGRLVNGSVVSVFPLASVAKLEISVPVSREICLIRLPFMKVAFVCRGGRCALFTGKLNAAVPCAAFERVIGIDRARRAVAVGGKAIGGYVVAGHESLLDGRRTAFR